MSNSFRKAMSACDCPQASDASDARQTPRKQPDRRRPGTAAHIRTGATPPRRRRRTDAFAAVRQSPLSWS
jgi:hypothetical protein